MKLFITNKEKFESDFPEYHQEQILPGSKIHKKAYHELFNAVTENSIPIVLMTDYDFCGGTILFDFQKRVNDVYFYEYTGTAK